MLDRRLHPDVTPRPETRASGSSAGPQKGPLQQTKRMICAGVDAGSRAVKVVLIDGDSSEILALGSLDQGIDQERRARGLFEGLCAEAGIQPQDVAAVVATGYGRHAITFAGSAITEISCQARGVRQLVPDVRAIIDIGGQDSKFIKLDAAGMVLDFAMNDRCAAGTGCFLEVAARRLDMPLAELGAAAQRSLSPAAISSMCVVFAETEIVGLMAGGTVPADIVAGIQASIAARIAAMAGRDVPEPVAFTGGVARIPGMGAALQAALGKTVMAAPMPQSTGAFGAALIAAGGRH